MTKFKRRFTVNTAPYTQPFIQILDKKDSIAEFNGNKEHWFLRDFIGCGGSLEYIFTEVDVDTTDTNGETLKITTWTYYPAVGKAVEEFMGDGFELTEEDIDNILIFRNSGNQVNPIIEYLGSLTGKGRINDTPPPVERAYYAYYTVENAAGERAIIKLGFNALFNLGYSVVDGFDRTVYYASKFLADHSIPVGVATNVITGTGLRFLAELYCSVKQIDVELGGIGNTEVPLPFIIKRRVNLQWFKKIDYSRLYDILINPDNVDVIEDELERADKVPEADVSVVNTALAKLNKVYKEVESEIEKVLDTEPAKKADDFHTLTKLVASSGLPPRIGSILLQILTSDVPVSLSIKEFLDMRGVYLFRDVTARKSVNIIGFGYQIDHVTYFKGEYAVFMEDVNASISPHTVRETVCFELKIDDKDLVALSAIAG